MFKPNLLNALSSKYHWQKCICVNMYFWITPNAYTSKAFPLSPDLDMLHNIRDKAERKYMNKISTW